MTCTGTNSTYEKCTERWISYGLKVILGITCIDIDMYIYVYLEIYRSLDILLYIIRVYTGTFCTNIIHVHVPVQYNPKS